MGPHRPTMYAVCSLIKQSHEMGTAFRICWNLSGAAAAAGLISFDYNSKTNKGLTFKLHIPSIYPWGIFLTHVSLTPKVKVTAYLGRL